jgi:hypothetical protein
VVNYSYSLKDGYKDLKVTLDGSNVPANGNVTMNQDHTIRVCATPTPPCNLCDSIFFHIDGSSTLVRNNRVPDNNNVIQFDFELYNHSSDCEFGTIPIKYRVTCQQGQTVVGEGVMYVSAPGPMSSNAHTFTYKVSDGTNCSGDRFKVKLAIADCGGL